MKSKAEQLEALLTASGQPLRALAPMAEMNDLAFRLLCRRHGVQLCFTGMINTHTWSANPNLRDGLLRTTPDDHPLIVQLSGSDAAELIATAADLSSTADAFDINLGCTHHIARRGQYGYFMVNTEDKRQKALDVVRSLASSICAPLTAKIRLLSKADGSPDVVATCKFARQLEHCGVSLISIHGRHRHLDKAGEVNVGAIRAVVEAVSVPVLANGGISTVDGADELTRLTGARGVMIGQALLNNPRVLEGTAKADPILVGREYLSYSRESAEMRSWRSGTCFCFLTGLFGIARTSR
jgi:tRNA-dihydrouridine synthase 1